MAKTKKVGPRPIPARRQARRLGRKEAKYKISQIQTREIADLLSSYKKSLSILKQYDDGNLRRQKKGKAKFVLKIEDCRQIIKELKKRLADKGRIGSLFGQEYAGRFEGIIKGLYQAYAGKEFYASLEEKAAHLLYFLVKDHPFVDGNKRIAAFLFVYFLERNDYSRRANGEIKISENALVTLVLLIAISNPREKETMVDVITNLIC
jgi:death-on-curing family protein